MLGRSPPRSGSAVTTRAADEESRIEIGVGRIGGAHGLRGELVVDVRTDEPDRRFAPGTIFSTPRGTLTVTASKWHGKRLLISFAEVADRTAAETWRGTELTMDVPADERPDDPEEFYDHQLVGLRVATAEGAGRGQVSEVLHLPAQDVLVIEYDGREVLVPFVAALVPAVDLDAGTLLVVDDGGLFDLGADRADDRTG